jgi:hypothetical protein
MSMNKGRARGRLQLILIGAAFLGPLLLAYFLFNSGGWAPDASTEHGDMLRPPELLPEAAFTDTGGAASSFRGKWSLIMFGPDACEEACRKALYETRQIRRALGRDMDRVQRLLYVGSTKPDSQLTRDEHPDLIVLEAGSAAGKALATAAGTYAAGDIFLADPLGNLIMRFPVETGMKGIHEDLKKLLKISRIG